MTTMRTIQTELGRTTGTKNLAAMCLNRFTRTLAGSGYRRVNPFQVGLGYAPSEEAAPHNLRDWQGYDHNSVPSGSQLAFVGGGYNEVTISWTKPGSYPASAGTGADIVRQIVFVEDTNTSVLATAIGTNPFTAGVQTSVGDVSSATVSTSFVSSGHYAAIGVKAEFNDGTSVYLPIDSAAYSVKAGEDALTGGGLGIAVINYSDTPSLGSVQQRNPTDPDDCFGGDTPDFYMTCTMNGPSTATFQRALNSGFSSGLVTIDSSVTAGASSVTETNQPTGVTHYFRLRYNDVDGLGNPGPWSTTRSGQVACNGTI